MLKKGFFLGLVLLVTACGEQSLYKNNHIVGSDDQSIVNGVEVASDDEVAKSIVALTMKRGDQVRAFCTATIIADGMAVTAAHCAEVFEGKDIQLLFGLSEGSHKALRPLVGYKVHENYNNITEDDPAEEDASVADEETPVERSFTQRHSPEVLQEMKIPSEGGFKTLRTSSSIEVLKSFLPKIRKSLGQNWNDVALIRFSGGLPEGYVPARLHKEQGQVTDLTQVILAGFGNTSGGLFGGNSGLLRKTTVPIAHFAYSDTEILTDETGAGSCNGDSGGPVFVKNLAGQLELIGVTSRGDANCRIFGIYSYLPAFSSWVESGLAELAQ